MSDTALGAGAPSLEAVETAWRHVQLARHPQRPRTLDLVPHIFSGFLELHGDRAFGDDPAIVGGPALLDGRPVMIIGHQKGTDTESNIARNFGSPHPEGFRKAQRLMRLAEKLQVPLVTFLDTAGAFPGPAAEERGQAEAIASSIKLMTGLRVPIGVVDVVVSEPGEGAHTDPDATARSLRAAIGSALRELSERATVDLLASRYARLRSIGAY